MKKILLIATAAFVSLSSIAQQKISIGVKAGISQAGIRGEAANNLKDMIEFADGMITTQSKTGFFAGASVTIPVSENIAIEPGLYYTQKGYALQGELGLKGIEFLGIRAKTQLNANYIDMPVLLKGNLGGLQLFAGPQLSYLANAELQTTAGALGFNVLNDRSDATARLHRWDAGVTAGLGYRFRNGLNISASYDHGLTKMDADRSLHAFNRAVKVGIGFNF